MLCPHCTGDLQLVSVQFHLVQVGQKVLSMSDVGTLKGRERDSGKENDLRKGGWLHAGLIPRNGLGMRLGLEG